MGAVAIDKLQQVRRVIVHGGLCPDGRASAMIVHRAFQQLKQPVSIEFVVHGSKEHEALTPEPGMLFVDFCVPHSKVEDFLAAGTIVLDHHIGKEEANKKVCLRFVEAGLGAFGDEVADPGVSGAVLAFDHVFDPIVRKAWKFDPDDVVSTMDEMHHRIWTGVKDFATVAGIRDTWQTSHPRWIESCEQAQALIFWPEEDILGSLEWSTLLALGPMLWKKRCNTTTKVSERAYRWTSKKGTRVVFFQGTTLSSDVAEKIDKEADLIIGYDITYENEKVAMQFSTRGHTHFNCVNFAASHGGGGHTKAAGFRVILDIEKAPNPYKLAMDLLDEYEAHV